VVGGFHISLLWSLFWVYNSKFYCFITQSHIFFFTAFTFVRHCCTSEFCNFYSTVINGSSNFCVECNTSRYIVMSA